MGPQNDHNRFNPTHAPENRHEDPPSSHPAKGRCKQSRWWIGRTKPAYIDQCNQVGTFHPPVITPQKIKTAEELKRRWTIYILQHKLGYSNDAKVAY